MQYCDLRDFLDQLEQRGQTAVLPEDVPGATVGGVVACGLSGWRRLRYGPTRDRVLETVSVTGDGRVIRGGARLVKNSTGYDLPRLLTGSFGSLGLIVQVCLKLWPEPEEHVTVTIDDPERAAAAYRPLAVIEDRAAAIAWAIDNARADDIILVAGKGHEDYQLIGSGRIDFSDFGVALANLDRRAGEAS